ncbi:unnamed protein product [Nesidiocoris tenuis]|uniref:Uncharacterized protein n=1 Tax=Nesidiocoris tenuis TaxID=355587 RepID=A0A6H5HFY3_9HEMI|nr:unnamed protein product [Nesidiocoris tenuis]
MVGRRSWSSPMGITSILRVLVNRGSRSYPKGSPIARTRVASGVVQGHDMVAPHGGSHGAMPTQMMNQAAAAAARQMVAPLPGFHPLASRTSMYNVQNAAAAAAAGNMYPAPQGYAQAAQRAQPLPPMILQQQYPINPPVSYKSIPFYDIKDVLLRPSTLRA